MTSFSHSSLLRGLVVATIVLTSVETVVADDSPLLRYLYPMAPAKAGDPPTVVIDTTDIADAPDSVRWAEESKILCEQWYPIIHRFLATEDWKPPQEIKLIFKKELQVPAYASGSTITISADWAQKHPDDFGCVIHELTHVIQQYPNQRGKPGWLVEGIADYIRFWKYEPEVPRPRVDREKASYRDSYRTTAAFLAWITWKYDKRIVKKVDKALREGTYSDAIFGDVTGRSLDALWEEFVAR